MVTPDVELTYPKVRCAFAEYRPWMIPLTKPYNATSIDNSFHKDVRLTRIPKTMPILDGLSPSPPSSIGVA